MTFNFFKHPFFIKLLHWEYWSFTAIYTPILPFYFWYALRARSFFFFSSSNPTIKNAGFEMESKFEIDKIIPAQYRPASLYFTPGTDFNTIQQKLSAQRISYPLIIKPDIGGRGLGVSKVEQESELITLVRKFPVPFIIQPFIDYPLEIGLFYVKMPGAEKGNITGIVHKEFLKVTGDGVSTILDLLKKENRYILQIPALKKILAINIHKIIPKGQKEILVPYGNHARGCLFLDHSHLITPKLIATFDKICAQIPQFHYGRLDIKFNTWEELEEGKNFSIIELNGAGSEPTHIYDPRHSLFFAWKEIIRHWRLLWLVSKKNKNYLKISYMSLREGLNMFKEKKIYNTLCNGFD